MLSGLKTHITGLVGLIVAALVGFGVITPDAEQEVAQAIIKTMEIGFALILAIQSLVAIFQRLAIAKTDKKAEAASTKAASIANRLAVVALCVLALPMLAGCQAGSKLGEIITNPDGKPVITGEVCVNTPQGRFCYIPDKPVIVEPNPTPAATASVTAAPLLPPPPPPPPGPTPPILPAAKNYTATLEK